jgi:hypothetical protein
MLLYILAMMLLLNGIAQATGTPSIYEEHYHPVVTWQTFIGNLFLVQAWNIFPSLSWNGAAWFVSVEFFLCLIFPIYLVVARRGWFGAVALIAGGIAGLEILCLTGKHGLDITFHNGIFRGMSAFATGVGMCVLYAKTKAFADKRPEWMLSLAQAVVLAWMGWGIFDNGWSHSPRDIYTVVPMLALVYVLAFDRGFAARFLQTRALAKLVLCDLHGPNGLAAIHSLRRTRLSAGRHARFRNSLRGSHLVARTVRAAAGLRRLGRTALQHHRNPGKPRSAALFRKPSRPGLTAKGGCAITLALLSKREFSA